MSILVNCLHSEMNTTETGQAVTAEFILQVSFLLMQVLVLILGACGIITPRYRPPDFEL